MCWDSGWSQNASIQFKVYIGDDGQMHVLSSQQSGNYVSYRGSNTDGVGYVFVSY